MLEVRLSRQTKMGDSNIDVDKLPVEIKDSFAKTELRSGLTRELQPLVDYFKNTKNVILDIINITDSIADNVEINKFVGLEYSETLYHTLGSMIRSEITRTCGYLRNKYGDDTFYDRFLNSLNTATLASSILMIICK